MSLLFCFLLLNNGKQSQKHFWFSMDEIWIRYHIRIDMINSSRVCYHKFVTSICGWQASTVVLGKNRTTAFYTERGTISCYTHFFLLQCSLPSKYLETYFSQKWPRNSRSLLQRWKETILHNAASTSGMKNGLYINKCQLFFKKIDSKEIKVRRFTWICQLHIASYSVPGYRDFCFLFFSTLNFLWKTPSTLLSLHTDFLSQYFPCIFA